jgi:hypothetical protein
LALEDLLDAVLKHTVPGNKPGDDVVDMYIMSVKCLPGIDAVTLINLINNSAPAFDSPRPTEEGEHNYIEVGAFVGDQGMALRLMALGSHLKLWTVITPKTIPKLDKALMDQMAGMGFVSIITK